MVHYEFLPQGRMVNKEYYLEVRSRLREAIRQKRTELCENQSWKTNQLNKFSFNAVTTRAFGFLLYMIILFKFKVAILKILYNMASANINLTFKVTCRMILALT